jgi:hypothetical protein
MSIAQDAFFDYCAKNRPTAGVTGKGGIWQTKPPDAESASWGRYPESVGECPHLSGARGVRLRFYGLTFPLMQYLL